MLNDSNGQVSFDGKHLQLVEMAAASISVKFVFERVHLNWLFDCMTLKVAREESVAFF